MYEGVKYVHLTVFLILLTLVIYFLSLLLLKFENRQSNSKKTNSFDSILKIYFATQTGNAEKLAIRVSNIIHKSLGIDLDVINLDNFEFDELLHSKIAIFIVSTCGDGEITDNSRLFLYWLEKLPDNSLSKLNYSLFGLGSREYKYFNAAAKIFNRILLKLGANVMSTVVWGDSQYDIDPDFYVWIKDLIPNLAFNYEIVNYILPDISSNLTIYKSWKDLEDINGELIFINSTDEDSGVDLNNLSVICKSQMKCVKAEVINKHFLIDNEVCQIDFTSPFKFKPADNISILYRTSDNVVNWWINRLSISKEDLDKTITFKSRDSINKKFIPPFMIPCTLYDALTLYCDLTTLPSTSELLKFTCFLTDIQEVKIITSMLSNKKILKMMDSDLKMTFIEFVDLFMSSAVFNLDGFLQLIPKKKMRQYTIASSPLHNPYFSIVIRKTWERLHPFKKFLTQLQRKELISKSLAIRLNDIKQKIREYKGACSNYLIDLQVKSEVYILHTPSKFNIDLHKPMMMIATGTGVAPFRSFWNHLNLLNIRDNNNILFYGCRNKEIDWLYRDEMERFVEKDNPVIGKLFLAFSRDQKEKVYVQHRILEQKQLILKHIFELAGKIFVCGNRNMLNDVKRVLISIFDGYDGVIDGGVCLDTLIESGSFVCEVWS